MERLLYSDLVKWKNSRDRKPLLLEGAHGTGRTWLLKEFGKNEYRKFCYIGARDCRSLPDVFYNYDIPRIVLSLSALSDVTITKGDTLIVIDDVEYCPKALGSLKYFCEDEREYHIIVTVSSTMCPSFHGLGFPVGKVDSMTLRPLSFMEFLSASGRNLLADEMRRHNWKELNVFTPILENYLREYFFTGGMPEAVMSYLRDKDIHRVRDIQKRILARYREFIIENTPKREIRRILSIWDSIPSQLEKKNRKFTYSALRKEGRSRDFLYVVMRLAELGAVSRVNRVRKLELPLKFHEDFDSYRLYPIDVGLLGAMADIPPYTILIGTDGFSAAGGSLAEEYILEEFLSVLGDRSSIFYYTNADSTLRLDFVIQDGGVHPIEVQAEENLRAKNLTTVLRRDGSLRGIRFSLSPYREEDGMVNVPLALAGEYFRSLDDRAEINRIGKERKEIWKTEIHPSE